jgi:type VI protein secretion system component Hcp
MFKIETTEPKTIELSDAELEAVSGGFFTINLSEVQISNTSVSGHGGEKPTESMAT